MRRKEAQEYARQRPEAALDEFDELGRDGLLEKYGYSRARTSFVERDRYLVEIEEPA